MTSEPFPVPALTKAIDIAALLSAFRWPLSNEKLLQADIETVLSDKGIAFEREVHLSASDIVDFMIDGVAVEVKIKGSAREIYRQLERYAAHERVEALVLATNRPMGLPLQINGRPARMVLLGRNWL